MGLRKTYLDYINESVNDTIGELSGRRMLELGNQHIHIKDKSISEETGKEYYINRGVEHVSIDLNGMDGAIKIDLSKPIDMLEWHNYFDVITNSGTTQHVEPMKSQYVCFMNIHNCLKVGGIAVHIVPDIDTLNNEGCWRGLCNYYYSKAFFKMLSERNRYDLVSLKYIDGNICTCIQKVIDRPFYNNEKEFLSFIARKKWGQVYIGINERGIVMRFKGMIIRIKNIMRKILLDVNA